MVDITLGTIGGDSFALRNNGDSSTMLMINSSTKAATFYGPLGFSQSRIQQSAAQTLQTQCYDTSLAAWQETQRQQASASGALVSLWGGVPALKPPAYTFSNVTTRRTINCDASSVDELADALATLYNDIKCLMGV